MTSPTPWPARPRARAVEQGDPDAGAARDDFFANMSAHDKARYEEAAAGLSAQQLQRLQNIFYRHDADKSGEIDVSPSLLVHRTGQSGGRARQALRARGRRALCARTSAPTRLRGEEITGLLNTDVRVVQVHELRSAMAELGTNLSLHVRTACSVLRSCCLFAARGGSVPSIDCAGGCHCFLQEAEKLISLMDESGDGLIQFWEFVEFFKPGIKDKGGNVTDMVEDTLKKNAGQ